MHARLDSLIGLLQIWAKLNDPLVSSEEFVKAAKLLLTLEEEAGALRAQLTRLWLGGLERQLDALDAAGAAVASSSTSSNTAAVAAVAPSDILTFVDGAFALYLLTSLSPSRFTTSCSAR